MDALTDLFFYLFIDGPLARELSMIGIALIVVLIQRGVELISGTNKISFGQNNFRNIDIPISPDTQIRKERRFRALCKAREFLKPYDDAFGNLTLANKNCSITFRPDANKVATVLCVSKKPDSNGLIWYFSGEFFGSEDEGIGTIDEANDFWSALCMNFSYSTTYINLVEAVRGSFLMSDESRSIAFTKNFNTGINLYKTEPEKIKKTEKIEKETQKSEVRKYLDGLSEVNNKDLTDINNASENEITDLPGINIVMAKKIMRYRDEVAPFKDFDDFVNVMKIKPHFAKKLESLIVIRPMHVKQINIKGERILDI